MFDRLSEPARKALTHAEHLAREMGQLAIGPEHLLVGLLSVADSDAARCLNAFGIATTPARARLAQLSTPQAGIYRGVVLTVAAHRALRAAAWASDEAGVSVVGPRELLLGVLEADLIDDPAGGPPETSLVPQLLGGFGVEAAPIARYLRSQPTAPTLGAGEAPHPDLSSPPDLSGFAPPSGPPSPFDQDLPEPVGAGGPSPRGGRAARGARRVGPASALAAFGVNLTAAAGGLDPLSGRETEIERMITILCRRTKNSPVLVGLPGVGKTAIVEGLAAKVAAGEVPEPLMGKQIWAIDLGAMVAGTTLRGDFEARVKKLVAEVEADPDVIVFIDEVHTVVGAGAAGGSMDLANILKPVLSRPGGFAMIGATTAEEYRRHISSDAALERRFAPVAVAEPSVAQTVAILGRLRQCYQDHHGVVFTDDALAAAAALSQRYVADRQLPDKAIDLIDEAGAAAAMDRRGLAPELVGLYAERAATRQAPVTEADLLRDRYLSERIAAAGPDLCVVDRHRVAAVLAEWVGVPVTEVGTDEAARLLGLEAALHRRVVGQHAAVTAVGRAVRRRRAGLGERRPPSFVFCGPTGVGKTELARALAEWLLGDAAKLIQIDMSEYMEKSSVSRLVGAPPGYLGYDDPGQLSEAVRRRPHSVVLLDEIEKAHPDVFNLFLQVLEDGHLTDGHGRRVDFTNTIIVMTTNLASTQGAARRFGFGPAAPGAGDAQSEEAARAELAKAFRPEFINRVDEVVRFDALTPPELSRIVEVLLARVHAQLGAMGITLELTAAATALLVRLGYDPAMGARPLRRAIQSHLENPLAEAILAAQVASGDHVVADVGLDGTTLVVEPRRPAPVTPPAAAVAG